VDTYSYHDILWSVFHGSKEGLRAAIDDNDVEEIQLPSGKCEYKMRRGREAVQQGWKKTEKAKTGTSVTEQGWPELMAEIGDSLPDWATSAMATKTIKDAPRSSQEPKGASQKDSPSKNNQLRKMKKVMFRERSRRNEREGLCVSDLGPCLWCWERRNV
jgi:hypothetical protein